MGFGGLVNFLGGKDDIKVEGNQKRRSPAHKKKKKNRGRDLLQQNTT